MRKFSKACIWHGYHLAGLWNISLHSELFNPILQFLWSIHEISSENTLAYIVSKTVYIFISMTGSVMYPILVLLHSLVLTQMIFCFVLFGCLKNVSLLEKFYWFTLVITWCFLISSGEQNRYWYVFKDVIKYYFYGF